MRARFSFPYFFYLLVVLSLFHLCFSNKNFDDDVLCMVSEREALVEFKHGLIDETDRLASWNVGEERDCCRWVGVTCDNSSGHIHRINLRALDGDCDRFRYVTRLKYEEASNQRLRGKLSSSLLHLKQLRYLDLSCNNFERIKVPEFIGSLTNLRYLNLSRSYFGGIVPPQLGNLSELHVLSLGSFQMPAEWTSMMNNMEWLSRLHLLQHLDLSGMDLSKSINWLQVINTIPSLVQLHMSKCQLPDIHPHVASLNLTSLSVLDLSYNYFNSSFPQCIFSITSMVSLDLTACLFHGLIPRSIYTFRNLTSLETLNVRRNNFMNSSLVLRDLSSVGSNLISLDISHCEISSSALDTLHNLTSVRSLDLSGNKLTKAIPKSLGNFCNLREIDLSENNFSNISLTSLLDSVFKCKSPHLKSLDCRENQISGRIPDFIGRLSFLRSLDLGVNKISGPIPPSIEQLSSLTVLDLSDNQLNGSLPESLGQLSNLIKLKFSSNLLTGVLTESHFSKLVNLKELNGGGNNLTLRLRLANWIPPFQLLGLNLNSWVLGPRFPWWLQSQKELTDLDISNTRISSFMPPESFWRSFSNLRSLDMSQNHIQGTLKLLDIPVTLDILDLSSNKFTGELTHLSNFSNLFYLDLSKNLFVGSLHDLLCSNGVNDTSDLYLGNNHFSGSIPECWEKWSWLNILELANQPGYNPCLLIKILGKKEYKVLRMMFNKNIVY